MEAKQPRSPENHLSSALESQVDRAEEMFKASVKRLRAAEEAARKASEASVRAEHEATEARQWHRFAREQFLDRAYYRPGLGPGHLVRDYDQWVAANRP